MPKQPAQDPLKPPQTATAEHALYFDYAATTPVDPQVIEVIDASLRSDFGNPSARQHTLGTTAAAAIDQARCQLASLINTDPAAITWTSGATEANNLAILGGADFYQSRGRHIICSAVEHSSVLTPMQQLQRRGYKLTALQPNRDGIIEPDQLSESLQPDTVLVSIQHANNETGVIQDIPALAECLNTSNALFHVDAAQSLGKIDLDVESMDCDLLSVSAHKMYGPKGIGALYIRRRPRINLTPMMFGGGQQSALRPGTLPTHQIVGFGKACEIASQQLAAEQSRLSTLQQRLLSKIKGRLDNSKGYRVTGLGAPRLPGIINLSTSDDALSEHNNLLEQLPNYALANGSACNSSQPGPSHVLLAMGLSRTAAASALRISYGRFTTEAEIDALAASLVGAL